MKVPLLGPSPNPGLGMERGAGQPAPPTTLDGKARPGTIKAPRKYGTGCLAPIPQIGGNEPVSRNS